MSTTEQLEQRINDLVRGVLAGAREVALVAVAEAFARNEDQLPGIDRNDADEYQRPRSSTPRSVKRRAVRRRRSGIKRSPDELAALGEKLCTVICQKPGESMTFYAAKLGSTPPKLAVPVRRLVEEGRVRAIGDRNQRRYYPGARV